MALASKHRDHRLASLIAQGGWGNPALMNLCREQLSEWERQNVSQCVSLHTYVYVKRTCVTWQWSALVPLPVLVSRELTTAGDSTRVLPFK